MYNLKQPCIIAPGKPNMGYHRVWVNGKRWKAHRYSYIMTYGPPPPEKPFILHKCNNPACWNPEHLYAGDVSDNNRDAVMAGTHVNSRKTHCPKGHLLSGSNLGSYGIKIGKRQCRICCNERRRINIPSESKSLDTQGLKEKK